MHPRILLSHRIFSNPLAAALVAASLGLGGCKSQTAKPALDLFNQGDYPGAYREAETIVASSKDDAAREQASLIAGMSAYELRRYEDAERWLRPVSRSTDREASGRAFATLGLVGVRRDRYSTAAIDLMSAGRRLQGDDAAQANFFAGECYTLLGDLDRARSAYNSALASAQTPALRERIGQRLAGSDYTLQLGVFSSRANADALLAKATRQSTQSGLGTPTIAQTQDVAGRTVFLVQLGRFKNRTEAVAARARLGMESVIVPAKR
jgi:tetratricopeptide (TPR) repeat protein